MCPAADRVRLHRLNRRRAACGVPKSTFGHCNESPRRLAIQIRERLLTSPTIVSGSDPILRITRHCQEEGAKGASCDRSFQNMRSSGNRLHSGRLHLGSRFLGSRFRSRSSAWQPSRRIRRAILTLTVTNTDEAGVPPPPGTFDPDLSDNEDAVETDVVEIATIADLAVVKTGPANVAAGGNAVHTIRRSAGRHSGAGRRTLDAASDGRAADAGRRPADTLPTLVGCQENAVCAVQGRTAPLGDRAGPAASSPEPCADARETRRARS